LLEGWDQILPERLYFLKILGSEQGFWEKK